MKEYDRLSKLSQHELQAYMMLKDPNNEFMRKLTLEGNEGLEQLQRRDLWASIQMKKQLHHDDTNAFLNSLTPDEFNEFINERDLPLDKLTETGRKPELVTPSLREKEIELREEHLKELLSLNNTDSDDHLEEDLTNELKVFRDPTFNDFVQIVGTQHNPELPLFAQLYICKEMLQFYQVN